MDPNTDQGGATQGQPDPSREVMPDWASPAGKAVVAKMQELVDGALAEMRGQVEALVDRIEQLGKARVLSDVGDDVAGQLGQFEERLQRLETTWRPS
jgi:uncharacterized protein (UPF0335 family)